MLVYSLEAFEKSGFVKQIIISAPAEHHEEIETMAKKYGVTKLRHVVSGGATRAESVICAFRGGVPGQVGGHAFFGGA